MGNRVIDASVAHTRTEGSGSNFLSSMVGQDGGSCVRLLNSDLSSTAHYLCDPGPIKSLVALVSSSVKACLLGLLRGLTKWIYIMNAEACMITSRAQQMWLWLKLSIVHQKPHYAHYATYLCIHVSSINRHSKEIALVICLVEDQKLDTSPYNSNTHTHFLISFYI